VSLPKTQLGFWRITYMARMRTLKPSFFLNEDLGKLSPLHRLLFQGLWCHADREGKLEDRPHRLKAQILPYDDCDVDQMLMDLSSTSDGPQMIRRYTSDGQHLILISNFKKHQRPSPREAVSVFPDHYDGKKHSLGDVEIMPEHCSSTAETPLRTLGSGVLDLGSLKEEEEATAAAPPVSLRRVGGVASKESVKAVYSAWSSLALVMNPKLRPPALDDGTARLIGRALRTHSEAELIEAMHGANVSAWHMEHGYWQVRHVLKDVGTITGHRDRWIKHQERTAR
jgi:hypothetical protein